MAVLRKKQGRFDWVCSPGMPLEVVALLVEWRAGSGQVELVKENPKRTVFRFECGGRVFYAKWHGFRGVADAVGGLLRGSRAAREWRNLLFLRERGVECAAPMALGVRKRWGVPVESFLVTEGVAGKALRALSEELAESVECDDAQRAYRLAEKTGAFIGSAHDAGLDMPDLHSENLFAHGADDAICVLDVHSARRVAGGVRMDARMQNLGFLCSSFAPAFVGPRRRMRFLRGYFPDESPRAERRRIMQLVIAEMAAIRERHMRSRSRRCMCRSSEFTCERTALGRVYRWRAMSAGQVLRAVELHAAVLAGHGGGWVAKRHEKTNVTLVDWDGTLKADKLCVKEFVRPRVLRLLPAAIRHGNALRGWKASLGLRVRGVRGPEALAVVLGKGRRSYLLMRAVESAGTLYGYVPRMTGVEWRVKRKRAFLRAAADALHRMYAAGVAHDDLKSTNVLVHETDGGWEFSLLDLDAVRFPGKVSMSEKLLNLAQLNAALPLALTWSDRLRFLRYLAEDDARLNTRETMGRIGCLTLERTCLWA